MAGGRPEQIRVDLVASGADKAAADIDKVADAAKDLEKIDPEVEVAADTSAADRAIDGIRDDVQALSRQDAEVLLRAKVDQAKGELRELQAELKQTGDKAEDTNRQLDKIDQPASGGNLRGNAIADLTGPLGEASSAASDFAGVFDGLGDAAEAAAGKLGLSQSAAAGLSSAVGGLGVAVAAGAAIWSLYSARQKKAREDAKKAADAQRDLNDAIKEGDAAAAAASFTELIGQGTIDKITTAGIGMKEFAEFVTGAADSMPGWNAKIAATRTELEAQADTVMGGVLALQHFERGTDAVTAAVDAARQKYLDANGTIQDQEAAQRELAKALGITTTNTDDQAGAQARLTTQADKTRDAFDRIRHSLDMDAAVDDFQVTVLTAMGKVQDGAQLSADEVLGIKTSIVDVAEYAHLNPVQVRALLDAVDRGEIAGVLAIVQGELNKKPVTIRFKNDDATLAAMAGAARNLGGTPVPGMAPTVNVTQVLPRGYHGNALGEARAVSRRAGRLYHRAGR